MTFVIEERIDEGFAEGVRALRERRPPRFGEAAGASR